VEAWEEGSAQEVELGEKDSVLDLVLEASVSALVLEA
jgi:hypothetical protein